MPPLLADFIYPGTCKPICEKSLTLPTSKKEIVRRKKEKLRTVTRSVTDPGSGLFIKGEHKRQFAYEAHTACDKHGFVLEPWPSPATYMTAWRLSQRQGKTRYALYPVQRLGPDNQLGEA